MRGQATDFDSPARMAFRIYLRTGRRVSLDSAVELKFNPYHDPRNGQFTFAPGGPRSLSDIIVSPRHYAPASAADPTGRSGRGGRVGRRGNIESYYDPMTLEQLFPGLRTAPGGAVIVAADHFLDLTGPASQLTAELTSRYANTLLAKIRKIDPHYRFQSLGSPQTFEGKMNYLNGLRMDFAAALYRVRGETEILKIETLRFLQRRVDLAYEEGVRRYNEGRLNVHLSREEAIGNFMDRKVREEVRDMYNQYDIRYGKNQRVQVVGREYETRGSDRTYTVPDDRIDRLGIDVTMTRKGLRTRQVQGFFGADIQLEAVAIVRPTQLPNGGTYIVKAPKR